MSTDTTAPGTTSLLRRPILELDTRVQPDLSYVRIDGADYALMHPVLFGLAEHVRLIRDGERVDRLSATAETDAERAELSQLLDAIVRRIVKAPDDVHQRLVDPHRLAIVAAYGAQGSPLPSAGAAQAGTPETAAAAAQRRREAEAWARVERLTDPPAAGDGEAAS
ncbi:MAG: hypothetical protein AB7U83_23420 [Vicinamibacterales bacterium]